MMLGYLPARAADNEFAQGVELYKKNDFQQACFFLERAVKTMPDDPNVLYYDALCWHQLKIWRKAADRYTEIMNRFPRSAAAVQAERALHLLSPYLGSSGGTAAAATASGGTDRANAAATTGDASRGGDAARRDAQKRLNDAIDKLKADFHGDTVDLSGSPMQSKVYYTQTNDAAGIDFIVDVYINGRPLKMVWDTGASTVVIGQNHLAQLGLPPIPANRKAEVQSVGVGSGINHSYIMHYDLKVGQMLAKNCLVLVQEGSMHEPLLGQTFLKHFTYTVDYGAKVIYLTRKDEGKQNIASSGSGGTYDIPFVREGNELVVTAQVNGRPYQFYFDTGAMEIAMTAEDARKLGLQIPDDATVGFSRGVGGVTQSWHFPVRYLKCGPIEKRDIDVAVVENSHMSHPLLGQTFYAGWQYTIDNENNVIHMVRR
jgi:clan AA aspartic protease (TIGR02281 family)